MKSIKEDSNIVLSMSKDEALVFLDWLTRFNEGDHPSLFQDQAEERVLFDIESTLEKVMSETFDGDYNSILSEAREKLRDKE